VLAESPFLGEGYRKVWTKLRLGGIRPSPCRVMRLMREHNLRAPVDFGAPKGPRSHEGAIIPPAPEGNGCVERVIRTLKEQLLWVKTFDTVEELRRALLEWAELYNERWMIQRHGHISPAQRRREYYAATEQRAA